MGRLSSACDAGFCFDLVWTWGAKHYVFVSTPASADAAAAQCKAMRGTLVVLESRDEREQLWSELGRLPGVVAPGAIWIGLSLRKGGDASNAADWVWDDDASPDAYASPWGEKQPRLGTAPRAYLVNNPGPPTLLDETLARDVLDVAAPFVCQLPVTP